MHSVFWSRGLDVLLSRLVRTRRRSCCIWLLRSPIFAWTLRAALPAQRVRSLLNPLANGAAQSTLQPQVLTLTPAAGQLVDQADLLTRLRRALFGFLDLLKLLCVPHLLLSFIALYRELRRLCVLQLLVHLQPRPAKRSHAAAAAAVKSRRPGHRRRSTRPGA